MKLTTTLSEDYIIISITGELDACSTVRLDALLEKAIAGTKPNLLIDCRELTYISSTGLGVFISHLQTLEAKKIKLVLFGMNDKISNVFGILGLEKLLTVTQTLEEAMAVCRQAHTVTS